jgi:hypothetical protein
MSLNYCKHDDFIIKAGTTFVETDRPRNHQLVVGGEWHDIEAVNNFQAIRCLPGGSVDKVKIGGALTQAADIPLDLESAVASVRDVPHVAPVEEDIGAIRIALRGMDISKLPANQIRRKLEELHAPVPRFLLDEVDPNHIPPHVAAIDLLTQSTRSDQSIISARRLSTSLELWLWTPFAVIMFLVQLLLEVFGGVGAVWGCAEVLHLREGFHPAWQVISLVVGLICLGRFCVVHAQASDRSFVQGHPHFFRLTILSRLQAVCRSPSSFLFQCR